MAHGLVQQHAAPAASQHHRQFTGRGRAGIEVHQRLAQGLIGDGFPIIQQPVIHIAAAGATGAILHPPVLLDDNADAQAHQRAHIGGGAAIGLHDMDELPAAGQGSAHLLHPGVFLAQVAVDFLQQLQLGFEGHQGQRVIITI